MAIDYTRKAIKQFTEKRTAIASGGDEGIFIPNHSGISTHPEATSTFLKKAGDTATGTIAFTAGGAGSTSAQFVTTSTGGFGLWCSFIDGITVKGYILESGGSCVYYGEGSVGLASSLTDVITSDSSNWDYSADVLHRFYVNTVLKGTWSSSGLLMGDDIDMNGNLLILDADGDTYIDASTDDQVKFFVSGAEKFRIAATNVNFANSTRIDTDVSNELTLVMSSNDEVYFGQNTMIFNNGATDCGFNWATNGVLGISIGGISTYTIDANGIIPSASSTRNLGDRTLSFLKLYSDAEYHSVVTKTGNFTSTGQERVILCDASSGAFTISLPSVADAYGVIVSIKKTDSSSNAITIDGSDTDTIDGASTQTLNSQWDCITITCTSDAWYII